MIPEHDADLADDGSAAGHVVVIGAGLAGLSAALHLRGAGYEVTVVERGPTPGGLVRTQTLGGHLFDTGATVLTMPELIDEALGAVGVPVAESRRRLGLIDVDPSYLTRFADGTDLAVRRGAAALHASVTAAFGAAAADEVAALGRWLRQLYDVEFDTFIDRNLSRGRELLSTEVLRRGAALVRLGGVRGLTAAVARFVSDPRLQRVFTFQALYAGVPPERARAVYGIIAEMDIGRGVFHPAGGMGRVGAVLAEACTDAGGTLRLSTTVTAIERRGNEITGVRLRSGDTDEFVAADAVVATTPIAGVAGLLGTALPRGPRWRRVRHSPSAVVVHGLVPTSVTDGWPRAHHTVDFGAAWRETFTGLTRRPGRLMADPSFLITRPAVSDPAHFGPADGGPGDEPVSVLAPCPNLAIADLAWDEVADAYVAECLQTLEDRGYHGISSMRIVGLDHPGTWAAAGLPDGTPFGAAHTLAQTGPLRTPNVWPGLPGLVLAGSATVPGVGIPPVLVSGRLAAERVGRLFATHTPARAADRPSATPAAVGR